MGMQWWWRVRARIGWPVFPDERAEREWRWLRRRFGHHGARAALVAVADRGERPTPPNVARELMVVVPPAETTDDLDQAVTDIFDTLMGRR